MALSRDGEAVNPMSDLVAASMRGVDEFVKEQTTLSERLCDANRRWFDRCQAEAKLLFDFGVKLMSSRSLIDTATAYQDFSTRQWEMASEDVKHIIADSEAFTRNSARMFANRALTGSGAST